MGDKENKTNFFLSNLIVKRKSKGNSFSERAVFCENGKSLIICHGRSCHLYNTSTGNHVKELFNSPNNIISHQMHPLDNDSIIAVTVNGEVTVYSLNTDEIEHSVQLVINHSLLNSRLISKFNFESDEEKEHNWEKEMVNSLDHRKFLHAEIKAFQGNPNKVLVWASWCLNDEIQAHVTVFSLSEGMQEAGLSFRKSRLKKCQFNFVLSKGQPLDLFIGMSNHCLHVVHLENKNSFFYSARKHYTGLNNALTCVAIHPTENCIATGDSIGRITLWKNIFDKYPLKEIFHWHSMMVRDIVFSRFGNYLFSGGEENVLVKWSMTARKKQFLPRLSSAICRLAEASETPVLSVLTADSRILILDFNFQCISTIQSFSKWCTLKERKKSSIFTIDPRSDCIVLNGKTGHIQFLSIREEGKLMYIFDVTSRNFVTSQSRSTVVNTEVTHAVFSIAGDWLITAENKKENACLESRLKFWKYVADVGSYALNTNVEFPHGGDGIYSLEISSDATVATTGSDKKFRLWTLAEHHGGSAVREVWSVHGDRNYRHHSALAVDFSKDGSLVAVTFSSILTIWETNSCDLKCTLSSPVDKDDLKVCKFGNREFTHLIVTGTESVICCWNTITLSKVWAVPFRLSILISDPFSIYMASFSKDQTLVVFNPSSPAPDLLLKQVCSSPVIAARCGSNASGTLSLFFINSDQDLFCLGGAEKAVETGVGSEENVSPVTSYVAQAPLHESGARGNSAPANDFVSVLKNDQKSVTDLLDSPAHTLSNPSLLCCQILKGLLLVGGSAICGQEYGLGRRETGTSIPDAAATCPPEQPQEPDSLMRFVKAIFA